MDFLNIMGQVQKLQQEMKVAKENLGTLSLETETGGGMVKVKMNGLRQVLSVTIDPEIGSDTKMIADLVMAAVNKAAEQVEALAKEHLSKATQGIIPGIDLSKFGL